MVSTEYSGGGERLVHRQRVRRPLAAHPVQTPLFFFFFSLFSSVTPLPLSYRVLFSACSIKEEGGRLMTTKEFCTLPPRRERRIFVTFGVGKEVGNIVLSFVFPPTERTAFILTNRGVTSPFDGTNSLVFAPFFPYSLFPL